MCEQFYANEDGGRSLPQPCAEDLFTPKEYAFYPLNMNSRLYELN